MREKLLPCILFQEAAGERVAKKKEATRWHTQTG